MCTHSYINTNHTECLQFVSITLYSTTLNILACLNILNYCFSCGKIYIKCTTFNGLSRKLSKVMSWWSTMCVSWRRTLQCLSSCDLCVFMFNRMWIISLFLKGEQYSAGQCNTLLVTMYQQIPGLISLLPAMNTLLQSLLHCSRSLLFCLTVAS